jgi:hypothetical protein
VTYIFTKLKIRNSLYALAVFAIALQLVKVNFYGSVRRDDNITRSFVDMTLENIPDNLLFLHSMMLRLCTNYELMIPQRNRNILLLNTRGFSFNEKV